MSDWTRYLLLNKSANFISEWTSGTLIIPKEDRRLLERFARRRKGILARIVGRFGNVSRFALVVSVGSLLFDLYGMAFGLFYEGIFYDNFAHFLTAFAFVAFAAEIAQHRGTLPLLVPGRRALVAGAVVSLAGGGAWEIVEMMADFLFPALIYNPPLDTVFDMTFGVLGGAIGAWRTTAYLNRKPLHNPSQ